MLATGLAVAGIAPFAASQTITEFPLPVAASEPELIIVGPDGAMWFTETSGNKIGRITVSGQITEFPVPTPRSGPTGIAVGSDGAIWFTEGSVGKIGRITTSGAITEYFGPSAASAPAIMTAGPDGALWFTELLGNRIGRMTTTGSYRDFIVPTLSSGPGAILTAPDGNIWFTESNKNKIAKITPSGFITEYPNPDGLVGIDYMSISPDGRLYFSEDMNQQLAVIGTNGVFQGEIPLPPGGTEGYVGIGPDGALWLVESVANKIARVGASTSGTPNYTEFAIPTPAANALALVGGPDGNIWFTETDASKIGRLTVPRSPTPLVAAVLPSSRSIRVGNTATAFATMINGGATTLTNCQILPLSTVPARFSYQTTNSSTNAVTGSPNTPVTLNAGASQSFSIAFQANAAVSPTDVALSFDCGNTDPAAPVTGLNTLLLSLSNVATPDVIALSATPSGDGILDIAGISGSNAFAVATANVGAAGTINASVDTGSATVPVRLTICQTNPGTGACLGTAGASFGPVNVNANETPTFSIFATGNGPISFAPAATRVFVRFKDAGGTVRGSTSVAIRTQ
jgi:sugar lactone lactonase YvrE